LAPLLRQFGLAGSIDSVEAFLRAVEEQVRREREQEDERMQED
jgi:hypothetical protein